eukprot:scaffold22759_cov111-Isochrysis_galbana.AAC.7
MARRRPWRSPAARAAPACRVAAGTPTPPSTRTCSSTTRSTRSRRSVPTRATPAHQPRGTRTRPSRRSHSPGSRAGPRAAQAGVAASWAPAAATAAAATHRHLGTTDGAGARWQRAGDRGRADPRGRFSRRRGRLSGWPAPADSRQQVPEDAKRPPRAPLRRAARASLCGVSRRGIQACGRHCPRGKNVPAHRLVHPNTRLLFVAAAASWLAIVIGPGGEAEENDRRQQDRHHPPERAYDDEDLALWCGGLDHAFASTVCGRRPRSARQKEATARKTKQNPSSSRLQYSWGGDLLTRPGPAACLWTKNN